MVVGSGKSRKPDTRGGQSSGHWAPTLRKPVEDPCVWPHVPEFPRWNRELPTLGTQLSSRWRTATNNPDGQRENSRPRATSEESVAAVALG